MSTGNPIGGEASGGDSYVDRRERLRVYFDRTAVRAWEQLTSDAPVSGIRQSVREGRERTRATLLSWLPDDLTGMRVLDAGCGTGALAVEAARRGADVLGIDVAPRLIELAAERAPADVRGSLEFVAGDMLGAEANAFDVVVAMDSLIHYVPTDKAEALAALRRCARADAAARVLFTFAPRTPALMLMKSVGRLFPRGDRSPAIEPIAESDVRRLLASTPALADIRVGRTLRIDTRFYKSQPMELLVP